MSPRAQVFQQGIAEKQTSGLEDTENRQIGSRGYHMEACGRNLDKMEKIKEKMGISDQLR